MTATQCLMSCIATYTICCTIGVGIIILAGLVKSIINQLNKNHQ